MSRPHVRDGEAPTFERIFRRMGELKGPHDGGFGQKKKVSGEEKGTGCFSGGVREWD